jgi:superfamily II DNA or RNA helicase
MNIGENLRFPPIKVNKDKLKPHQLIPVEFIRDHQGIIVYHSTGAGKTRTGLVGMFQFDRPIIILGPRSSKKAFQDEFNKLEIPEELIKGRVKSYTYQKIKNIMYDDSEIFRDKCVIVDEAHALRNETPDNIFLNNLLKTSYRIMLMTATPVINYLNDICVLVNLAKGREVLPQDSELFNFLYFDEKKIEIVNEDLLREKLTDVISYYEKIGDPNYPTSNIIIKRVTMDESQIRAYREFVIKLLYDGVNPGDGVDVFQISFDTIKKKKRNAFLTATRQISNSINGSSDTPKIKEIFKTIQENPLPGIVYSNFLGNGLYPLAKLLNKADYKFKLITGATSSDRIVELVNMYNAGQLDLLLLSSAGSESLDLKNTRQVHIVEPHWNEAKINQVIGRSVRYGSHSSLPPSERNVVVYRWISVFPETFYNISADDWLMKISAKKKRIFDHFKDMIISSSIERNMNKKNRGGKRDYYKYQHMYSKLRKQIKVKKLKTL